MYAPKIYDSNYETDIYGDFTSFCSSNKSDNCAHLKGFRYKSNKFVSGNYLPNSLDLNLMIQFSIIENQGEFSFLIKITNSTENEKVYVTINGLIEGGYYS